MSSLISAVDITHIATEAASMLPDTCTIRVSTTASDSQGGNPPTFSDTYTDVACRLAPFTQRQVVEMQMLGQIVSSRPFWLTLLREQTIGISDHVVRAAITYEVVYIDVGKSYQATKRVQIVRVKVS